MPSKDEGLIGCATMKGPKFGVLAQLVERLLRKQKVAGSSPVCSTKIFNI